jgi:hypothetical protein
MDDSYFGFIKELLTPWHLWIGNLRTTFNEQDRYTEYPNNTFTIPAIIKLSSINAEFFTKLVVHNAKSCRSYGVVQCTWLFCLLPV